MLPPTLANVPTQTHNCATAALRAKKNPKTHSPELHLPQLAINCTDSRILHLTTHGRGSVGSVEASQRARSETSGEREAGCRGRREATASFGAMDESGWFFGTDGFIPAWCGSRSWTRLTHRNNTLPGLQLMGTHLYSTVPSWHHRVRSGPKCLMLL